MFNFKFIRYTLSNLTFIICILMFVTLLVSLYYNDGHAYVYIRQIIVMLVLSYLLKYKIKISEIVKLRVPDLFITTTIVWIYVIVVCMTPYIVIKNFSLADAFFEMTSGVTTTGASIIPTLKTMPISLLFWRSITQWLGGIGFVVVGVLILPNLNTGGMKLFKTESSDTEEKAFPHYKVMAWNIVAFYLFITLACATTYWVCGMQKIDAIQYAFTTLATGGFTPVDAPFTKMLTQYAPAAIFLYLASLPFQVFAINIMRRSPLKILKDKQIQVFTTWIMIGGLLITLDRFYHDNPQHLGFITLYKYSIINILNITSNTGYTISAFWNWGAVTFGIMLLFAFLGGCSGSTAGGLKMFRLNILYLFLRQQFYATLHPKATNKLIYNGQVLLDEDIKAILFYVIIYLLTMAVGILIYTFLGLTISQAASSTITCITNTGLSFGPNVSDSGAFATQTDAQKFLGSFLMILGRLEFTTLLILFLPKFWSYS